MTLCVIVSAYCGSHTSLTNISQIFKYTNLLLKRCSKIGCGDVLLCFQDIYGKWTKYKWMNWIQSNGRKSILNNVSKQQNICLQQLQKQTESPQNESLSIIHQLKECIIDCKQHQQITSSSPFIYNIALIGNEHCLSYNDAIYLDSTKSNIVLQEILSLSRDIPLNINMLCLCSPLKHNIMDEQFDLMNNCCSVCNQQFFRSKPNKKQHFPKSCHQIALKQIKIQNKYKKDALNDNNEPPLKRRKLNENEYDDDELSDVNVYSIIFWQKLIDASSGLFRWMFTDFNQSNIDLVFNSLTNKIASHSKLRYIAVGCLMGQCMIFPGPNNEYFLAPNNSKNKLIKFESLNEKQIEFEIKENKYNNCFMKSVHSPFNIFQENNVNISIGCDVLSVLGFLDGEHQWLPIPILSRHFVIPFNSDNANNNDILVFICELLYKYNKIGLVQLNPPNKANWFGFIHSDKKSKGQYLLLDILSPFINVEQLLMMESKGEPTVQYRVNPKQNNPSMLNVFDSVSAYFPSETNIIKEFDKFIRLFKQKKIVECFEIAETIRKRSWTFHIPHLIKHLLSIINKEIKNKEKEYHEFNPLMKLINEAQNDERIKIVYDKKRHKNKNKDCIKI